MRICPECQGENPEHYMFCLKCGHRLGAPPAETPDHRIVRGDGKWHQDNEAGHADRDVGPLQDVGDDGPKIEGLIEHQVGREVQHGVVEGQEAERPAIAKQIEPGHLAQGRDHEARKEKAQRPQAERVLELAHRIGTETIRDGEVEPPHRRHEAQNIHGEPR